MRSVVALTRPAINLASSFEAYPQYTVYKISKHAGTGPRDYCLPDLRGEYQGDDGGIDLDETIADFSLSAELNTKEIEFMREKEIPSMSPPSSSREISPQASIYM